MSISGGRYLGRGILLGLGYAFRGVSGVNGYYVRLVTRGNALIFKLSSTQGETYARTKALYVAYTVDSPYKNTVYKNNHSIRIYIPGPKQINVTRPPLYVRIFTV